MRIAYDAEVDILTIDLVDDLSESPGAIELAPGLYADFTEDGRLLAVEILNASTKYPREELKKHPANYDEPISLAEAAYPAGMTPKALQLAIQRGRLQGRKIGRNWTTTINALHAYLESRKHEGPGSAAVAERTQVATTIAHKKKAT